jgi:hypothetical protein
MHKLLTIVAMGTVLPVAASPLPSRAPAKAKAPPVTPVAGTPGKLYDFKGVALETSLEDFRKLPHPDGAPAGVVCTGEKVAVTRSYSAEPIGVSVYDETEKALGVKRCLWISTGEGLGSGSTAGLSLANSGYASYSYTFSFIKDPKDNVDRLYRYSGTTNVAAFGPIVGALTAKWGTPVVTKGAVQNRIGNSFDKETAVWSNPLASITIESRYTKIDDMNLVMKDTRLSKIVSDAVAAKTAAKPNAI